MVLRLKGTVSAWNLTQTFENGHNDSYGKFEQAEERTDR